MPEYIVESRGDNNPAIMKRADDGSYEKIAFGAGFDLLPEMLTIVRLANSAIENG